MSWHERMNQAIAYIENNLCAEIDLEHAARLTYQTVTSFQRVFSIVAEISLSEYIRRRRMSHAAHDLQHGDEKIIDIAFKYNYDSPDAFARAFKEIYGVSPSAARNQRTPLARFSRITFHLTTKGNVVLERVADDVGVQIANMYYMRMPALRLVGRPYTGADLDADITFSTTWNEWFQNKWFEVLFEQGKLPGHENTVICGFHEAEYRTWWFGVFFPADAPVPEGFSFVDIPAGVVGMSWVRGYRYNREIYDDRAHDLCARKWREAGNAIRTDFDGRKGQWSFERYDNARFFTQDNDGRVILDYAVYLDESAISEQVLSSIDDDAENGVADARGAEPEPAPEPPEVRIEGMAPYCVGIQSDLLCCALSTIFLKLEYNRAARLKGSQAQAEAPDLCCRHMALYQFLLTATGIGLMAEDTNRNGMYEMQALPGILPPNLEDRLDFAMRSQGFMYTSLEKTPGKEQLFWLVMDAVRQDKPVLMKLDDGPEWCVVTGFHEGTQAVYGLDSQPYDVRGFLPVKRTYTKDGLFVIRDWFRTLHRLVIVTGETTPLPFCDAIGRMVQQLRRSVSLIPALIPEMLDAVTPDTAAGVAEYLHRLNRYVAEARWHVAECLASLQMDGAAWETLRECADACRRTNETCWKIWGQLCVGIHTDYRLPKTISQLMLDAGRREKIKELFETVWENDRLALEKLSAICLNFS